MTLCRYGWLSGCDDFVSESEQFVFDAFSFSKRASYDTRVHGPWARPENSGSVVRA